MKKKKSAIKSPMVFKIRVDLGLLKEADSKAIALGFSRAELVARALRALLAGKSRKSKAA